MIGRRGDEPGDGFVYLVSMVPRVEDRFEWLEVTEAFTTVPASRIEGAMGAWDGILCPTLPGVFASLIRDLRAITNQDPHLDSLMTDFEESVRDLRIDCSDRRIKTSIQKQVNLLEALGRIHPGVNGKTLSAISKQLKNWPHEEVMLALQSLYTFTCDYPGIRHGGTPTSALRAVDMRDMVAMSILLVGFTPYLTDRLNPEVVFRGT